MLPDDLAQTAISPARKRWRLWTAISRRCCARPHAGATPRTDPIISYSRKVFIPLTKLCRDVCHYCTFAQRPRKHERAYLSLDEVLAIARAGRAAGCKEALFTLGDQPERRYRTAAAELARLGHPTTLSYLAQAAAAVLEQTGLLPHLNPGHLTSPDVAALRAVSLSQGLMLESASERLCERGGPHHGSPDKHPQARLASIRAAGEQRVPFTSGILVGIGETREERIDSLLALRELNDGLRAHPGNHHPEFPSRNPQPAWPARPRRRSRSICGRSQSRDCCSRRR